MQAYETYGHVDKSGTLKMNTSLPLQEGEVKIIILYKEDGVTTEEGEWLHAISRNPAFDFLRSQEEDIYSLTDGKPFND